MHTFVTRDITTLKSAFVTYVRPPPYVFDIRALEKVPKRGSPNVYPHCDHYTLSALSNYWSSDIRIRYYRLLITLSDGREAAHRARAGPSETCFETADRSDCR